MKNEKLTPEEIDQIKKEHLEWLKKKDAETRMKVQRIREENPQLDIDESTDSQSNKELSDNESDDPNYVLVEDESGNKRYVPRDRVEKRIKKRKIRKKHKRNLRSFTRDYLSIVFILIVMVVLVYYAYKLTP
ncbi:MAG: hypothetical protein N2450_04485 [bacterium]|nr:hypothetical protein [bacterium]